MVEPTEIVWEYISFSSLLLRSLISIVFSSVIEVMSSLAVTAVTIGLMKTLESTEYMFFPHCKQEAHNIIYQF